MFRQMLSLHALLPALLLTVWGCDDVGWPQHFAMANGDLCQAMADYSAASGTDCSTEEGSCIDVACAGSCLLEGSDVVMVTVTPLALLAGRSECVDLNDGRLLEQSCENELDNVRMAVVCYE